MLSGNWQHKTVVLSAKRDILLIIPIERRKEMFRLEIRPVRIDNVDI
jgi:hypothetical protein